MGGFLIMIFVPQRSPSVLFQRYSNCEKTLSIFKELFFENVKDKTFIVQMIPLMVIVVRERKFVM